MSLEITKVRVNKIKNRQDGSTSKVVALATVLLNETFAINKISVVNGSKGVFVSMPRTKNSKDEWEDICNPVTAEFRKLLEKAVLDEYEKIKD